MLIVGDCNYQKSTSLIFQNQYITASLHISSENLDYFPTRKQRNAKKTIFRKLYSLFFEEGKGFELWVNFLFPGELQLK